MKILQNVLLVLLLISLKAQAVYCQEKIKMAVGDYEKWHSMEDTKISADGLWCSYKLLHHSTKDTMVVQQMHTGKKISFPKGSNVVFGPKGMTAVVRLAEDFIAVMNLANQSIKKIDSVSKYEFSITGKFLIVLQNTNISKRLTVYSTQMKELLTVNGSLDFAINEDGKLAISGESGITIYDLENKNTYRKVVENKYATYSNLLWSKFGAHFAFLQEENEGQKVFVYTTKSRQLRTIGSKKLEGIAVTEMAQTPLSFSSDGNRLFFQYTNKGAKALDDSIVEVWESTSKLVYPAMKMYGTPALAAKLAVWDIKNDNIMLLATDELPNVLLTRDEKFALTYSYLEYEPQNKMTGPVDLYITDINSGQKSLLLSEHILSAAAIGGSPSGRYINYYKNKNWYVYDILTKTHIDLTAGIDVSFENPDDGTSSMPEGYMAAGWTVDSNYLIVYDRYDLWLLSPNKQVPVRITTGAEKGICYRIINHLYDNTSTPKSTDFITQTFDLTKGLLLSAQSEQMATGFYKWNKNRKIDKIAFGDYNYYGMKKSADSKKYLFIKENFETPPALYYASSELLEPQVIFQSNAHHLVYDWGKSKLLTYKNTSGVSLNGSLFYPAGYEQGKQYPMIVYIYSKESVNIHNYINPTMYDPIGFAVSNYTNDGYIVFKPDIIYKIGEPGTSILDCVNSGLQEVLKMKIVEENHIGLLGHSYGGHEVALLITKTSQFAAAVASAAVTDMISSYLSVNETNGMKMDWRFESFQYRMGSTPFNNLKGYLENSPVINAEKIVTPLLLWNGKNDYSVNWKQGVELHLALRRLNKPNTFLVYPNQGHILTDPAAQYDLTLRNKNWFDYYLKNKPIP